MSRRRPRPRGARLLSPAVLPPAEDPFATPSDPVFAKRRPGRPSLLTPEVEGRFLGMLMSGCYRNVAAQAVGLKPTTVEHWMLRGRGHLKDRPPSPEYVRFVRLVEQAEAMVEAKVVGNIVSRSRHDHNAGLVWLRTMHPDRWPRFPGGSDDEEPGPGGYGPPNPTPPMPPTQQIGSSGSGPTNVIVLEAKDWPELAARLVSQQREERERREAEAQIIEQETPQEMSVGVPRHERLDSLRVSSADTSTDPA